MEVHCDLFYPQFVFLLGSSRSLSPILPVRRSTRSASVIIPLEDKNQESVIKDRYFSR